MEKVHSNNIVVLGANFLVVIKLGTSSLKLNKQRNSYGCKMLTNQLLIRLQKHVFTLIVALLILATYLINIHNVPLFIMNTS